MGDDTNIASVPMAELPDKIKEIRCENRKLKGQLKGMNKQVDTLIKNAENWREEKEHAYKIVVTHLKNTIEELKKQVKVEKARADKAEGKQ